MFNTSTQSILIFVLTSTLLILVLVGFITVIIYRYRQKQNTYYKDLEELKITHENALLQSQLEIQEQTFQNISREIHDNIGQKLTLAKLYLNTLNFKDADTSLQKTNDSIELIGEAINDLSDVSRSMSSEVVLNNGLIRALEFETKHLQKSGLYNINLNVTGETIFLEANKELVLFRIIQEALNNIVKHASATIIDIQLHYELEKLTLVITDNGKGFAQKQTKDSGTGLTNMRKRANTLNGKWKIISSPGIGTRIKVDVPFHDCNATI